MDSDTASYKQKLEVLQQQEELIEDEDEQEHKEEEARRAKREHDERVKREEEARMAESLLPESEVHEFTGFAPRLQTVLIPAFYLASNGRSRRGRCAHDYGAACRACGGSVNSLG